MDKVAIAETAGRIVLVAGTIMAVRLDLGLLGIAWAIVAGSLINFLLLYIFSLKMTVWKFAWDFSMWKEIAQKSWPLALTIFFNLLYLKTDTLILSLSKSSDEVGIYGAAYKVLDILTVIPFMFAGVILPILTADWAGKNYERFQRVLQKSFDLMVILAVPLVVGTQFVARPLMAFVAGAEFTAAGSVLKILIYAAGLVFISCFFSHAIVAAGEQRKIIWAYFFTAVTSVALYLFFIPRYSYFGAAAITIYSETAITIFMIYYALRYTHFFPRLWIFLKSLGAAAVMGALMYLVPPAVHNSSWGLMAEMLLAAAAYFTALFLLGGVSKHDLNRLLNREIEKEKF
jgi:O-antigen/teichoic acid export membrane protein